MDAVRWKSYSKNKIINPQELAHKVAQLRAEGKRIATLNGSFDLLHAGHLFMLYEAAQVADVLILGVNSDASVRAYKDPKRPIVPLEYRMEMLTAIEFVDYVTWFDELDPRALLRIIKPDVHVNGIEYGPECIEAEVVREGGGRLHLVPRLPGLATTDIVSKIKAL